MRGVEARHAPNGRRDLFPGGAVDLRTAAPVDVQVHEAGRDQDVTEVHHCGAFRWGALAHCHH